jgi:hypothetical protein
MNSSPIKQFLYKFEQKGRGAAPAGEEQKQKHNKSKQQV